MAGSAEKTEWYDDVIKEMREKGIDDLDVATTEFVRAYDGTDDELKAYDQYHALAKYDIASIDFPDSGEGILVFSDGSCYATWEQGIYKFFPDTGLFLEQNPEFAEKFQKLGID